MNEISVKKSEICYQTRLIHICTNKPLHGALLKVVHAHKSYQECIAANLTQLA